ncbi:MAG TPA: MATE family efflux transporter [Hyphomicrobiaceae bacterium]|nr:MATE family efflux transporter [Hyphomicrobiaceae bacterium]
MTSTQTLRSAGAPVPAAGGLWRSELAETVRLALPMALTQLGQIVMMTTDLVLIGRLGDEALAAAALAHTVLFAAFTLGMGLVSAVAPLAAQAYGARQPRMVRRALRVGIWAGLILGVPLTAAQFWGADILVGLGQEPHAASLAGRYLTGMAWAIIPGWMFIALRNFMGAVNRPEPALWITLFAIPVNAALAYALIYGVGRLPGLDLLGAGLATAIVNAGMCVAAVVIAYTRRPFKKYRVLGRFWRPDWPLLAKLVAVGLPISGALLLEYGLFAAAALLMGRISTSAVAAHQIALQTAAVLYMVPFGIALAATVRVGQAVGRRDAVGARRAGFVAIGLAIAFMGAMTLIVGLTRHMVPLLFLGTEAPNASATMALAATLLLLGATFFITDGLQTAAGGALRGLNDTRVPLLFAAFSFWAVGFASCVWLGFALGLGAIGVWIGLSLATAAYAALLVWRFHLLTARGYLPAVPTAA